MKSRLHRLVAPADIRAEGDSGRFEGYASVFGVKDSYSEIVAPGAFKDSLLKHREAGTMPAMLWQHDADKPVGVYEDMREDSKGLLSRGNLLLETSGGRDAHIFLKAKAVNGLSIGFMPEESDMDHDTGIRTLTKVDLWEVSIVTFPANPAATVTSVKAGELETTREIEHALRDAGFSRSEAVALMRRHLEIAGSERDAAAAMANLQSRANRLLEIAKSV